MKCGFDFVAITIGAAVAARNAIVVIAICVVTRMVMVPCCEFGVGFVVVAIVTIFAAAIVAIKSAEPRRAWLRASKTAPGIAYQLLTMGLPLPNRKSSRLPIRKVVMRPLL